MRFRTAYILRLLFAASVVLLAAGCGGSTDPGETAGPAPRSLDIPDSAVKGTAENDDFPPVLLAAGWEDPVPLEGPVNTAGAEDAPVISPEGDRLFFFFTGDVSVPPYLQINRGTNGATGIWWTRREAGGAWSEPERIITWNEDTLDGPLWLTGDSLWYASFRSDNRTENGDVYLCRFDGASWSYGWSAGDRLNAELDIGELCATPEGDTLIYHAAGGAGGYDLWMVTRSGGSWSAPASLGEAINTGGDQGWPALSPDGSELWYTANSAAGYTGPSLWRSLRAPDGSWGTPEEIVASFAGDPAVDREGNVYFTHHFMTDGMEIIEADIYVIRRR